MIKSLDVTEQVKPLLPSLDADVRIAMSAGALAAADKADEAQRLTFVAGLVWNVLHGPGCKRQRIDEQQTSVAPPIGPRFVLIAGGSPDGGETLAIVTFWEWVMHVGDGTQPEVEVIEIDRTVRRYAN